MSADLEAKAAALIELIGGGAVAVQQADGTKVTYMSPAEAMRVIAFLEARAARAAGTSVTYVHPLYSQTV